MPSLKILDSSSNLVTKSNMLIEANYKLGVVEQKIILFLASKIHPNDFDFKTYNLPIKEFNKLLGLKGNPKYTELRQLTKELMQKVFEIRIDKKVIQVAWLSYVAYNETEGSIDIRFDPFLRPYLLQLKKEFTSYKLDNVVKLKSSYAIRIYELLKQYERLQERTFPLEELRKMLGAEDIYPAYGNFKQRVLVPAQKELQKKTDISFDIEEIKEGRRVEKLKFIISSATKKDEVKQLNLFEPDLQEVKDTDTFQQQVKRLALNMGIQLTDDVLSSWEKYGQVRVIEVMNLVSTRRDIENPIGYITTVLKSTPATREVAATSELQSMLTHLIAKFRKSAEIKPDWFIRDLSVEELQSAFGLEKKEALEHFEKLKKDLFEVLRINEDPVATPFEEGEGAKRKKAGHTLEQYLKTHY